MKNTTHIRQHIAAYFLDEEQSAMHPALQEWIGESEQNRLEFEDFRKIWKKTGNIFALKQYDTQAAWRKVNGANCRNGKRQKPASRMIYSLLGIAASLLLAVLVSTLLLWRTSPPEVAVVMETTYGNRSHIVLPDGSSVKLNAGSKIIYGFNPKEKRREVALHGEAYFEVSKNEAPFVVAANGMQVKVHGTTFNLSAYDEDLFVEITLMEGAVEVVSAGNKLVLAPGETALYDKESDVLKQVNRIATHASGWLDNKIYMDDTPLPQLCRQLERMYDVHISLREVPGETIRYNGVVRAEGIAGVLDALQKLSKIKYEIKGKNIYITSK